jgi:DNA-binding HxlR family transcriptional regulator
VPLPREYEAQSCPLARSLEIVGERWTLLILRDLFFGVRRFGELQARLDIPRAVLSARLATLVESGLVERRPYRPGRDELGRAPPHRRRPPPALLARRVRNDPH